MKNKLKRQQEEEKNNQLINDNGQKNEAFQMDAIDLIGQVDADVMYLDTPYVCRGGCYEGMMVLFDDWSRNLMGQGQLVINSYDEKADITDLIVAKIDKATISFDEKPADAENAATEATATPEKAEAPKAAGAEKAPAAEKTPAPQADGDKKAAN